MKKSTGSRFLRIAIVGSLFVHAIFALVVRSHAVQAAPEQRPAHSEILVIHMPTPTPEPPKPKVVVHPHQAVQPIHRPQINVQPLSKSKIGPSVVVASAIPGTPDPGDFATPGVGPTGEPETPAPPTVTPKPACSAPDVSAKTIDAVSVDRPDGADATNARTQVRVDLDANGKVTGASVYTSSGDQVLDMAAVRAAKASRYAPEERDCKNVPGSYLFTVDFQE